MTPINKKTDYILWILIILSVFTIIYSFIYLFNYYNQNDILLHFPKSIDKDNKKLNPNEIGDSIGGILNPILAFTGAILTFLAFYIQYKANQTQRELFEKGLKEEKNKYENDKVEKNLLVESNHIVNLKIFSALINSMLEHYELIGEFTLKYITLEKKKPLKTNIYNFTTNASYNNFQKLDFTQLYNSIVFNFKNSTDDWEKELIDTLNYLDFYHNLINEMREKHQIHSNKKYETLSKVGEHLDAQMGSILSEPTLSNFNGITAYFRIVHNRDSEGNILNNDLNEGVDFEDLQNNFFIPFLIDLKQLCDKSKTQPCRNLIETMSQINKKIGTEKFQALNYINELEKKYNAYFKPENEFFIRIKKFNDKIITN